MLSYCLVYLRKCCILYYLEKSEDGYSAIKGNMGFSMEVFFLPQSKFKKNPKIKNRSSKVNLKNK